MSKIYKLYFTHDKNIKITNKLDYLFAIESDFNKEIFDKCSSVCKTFIISSKSMMFEILKKEKNIKKNSLIGIVGISSSLLDEYAEIIKFYFEYEEIVKRTLRRDLNLLAMKLLGEENIMECIGRDFVKEYADSRHITVQEAKKEIRNESKRKRDIEEVKIAMAFEEIESMYAEQLECGLYFAGADQIVFPTNF